MPRVLAAKFSVNLVCNIVMTSLFMKWDYLVFYGAAEAQGYAIINLVRIVKNLVLFPLEAILILLVLDALRPALRRLGLYKGEGSLKPTGRDIFLAVLFLILSVALVLFYIFFLKEYISAHNLKLW